MVLARVSLDVCHETGNKWHFETSRVRVFAVVFTGGFSPQHDYLGDPCLNLKNLIKCSLVLRHLTQTRKPIPCPTLRYNLTWRSLTPPVQGCPRPTDP